MNRPQFYIYGVPDGFNMLSGTPDEILYYQLFYDTTKRGRELRINRKFNGDTIYSYLIYNLVACKGRAGAFFGMSIVFSGNEYCKDTVLLKELFETIYDELIIKADDSEKIISSIDGANAVGRFCVSKFEERKEMCEKIGRIIISNVESKFSNSIGIIDSSFDNRKEGRILTLPFNVDNDSINNALRSYAWVSLSQECKNEPKPQEPHIPAAKQPTGSSKNSNQDSLSVHFINELSQKVGTYKDFIIKALKDMVSYPEIQKKREEINHHLDTIEEYIGRQPELKNLRDDYMSIYKELVEFKPASQPKQPWDNPKLPVTPGGHVSNFKMSDFINKHFSIFVAGICAIFVILAMFVFWPKPDKDDDPSTGGKAQAEITQRTPPAVDSSSQEFNETEFLNLLDNGNYKEAWSLVQKIRDAEKKQQFEYKLQNSYRDWFSQEIKKYENDLQGLYDLKNTIIKYADFNADNQANLALLDDCISPLEAKEREKQAAEKERLQRERDRRAQQQKKEQEDANSQANANNGESGLRVIRIFKANSSYEKAEDATAPGNTITCRRNEHFVIEGARLTGRSDKIEATPNNGQIRIRVPNIGQHKIKLNQVEYTFNVQP